MSLVMFILVYCSRSSLYIQNCTLVPFVNFNGLHCGIVMEAFTCFYFAGLTKLEFVYKLGHFPLTLRFATRVRWPMRFTLFGCDPWSARTRIFDSERARSDFLTVSAAADRSHCRGHYPCRYATVLFTFCCRPILAKVNQSALTLAKVHEAKVNQSALTLAKVHEAKVNQSALTLAKVREAKVNQSALTLAKVHEAKVNHSALTLAKVHEAKVNHSALTLAKVHEAKVNHSSLTSAKVHEAKVNHSALTFAKVHEAKVNHSALTLAKVHEAKVNYSSLTLAKVDEAKGNQSALTLVKVHDCHSRDFKLAGFT